MKARWGRRLERLEKQAGLRDDGQAVQPRVEIWIPDNGRGDATLGRHVAPGGGVLVIYPASEAPAPRLGDLP